MQPTRLGRLAGVLRRCAPRAAQVCARHRPPSRGARAALSTAVTHIPEVDPQVLMLYSTAIDLVS